MDMTAEDRGNAFATTLTRNMRELHARVACHSLHGDRISRLGTDSRVGEPTRIGLRELEHVLPFLERAIGLHDPTERVTAEHDDGGEVGDRIVGRLLYEGDPVDRNGD